MLRNSYLVFPGSVHNCFCARAELIVGCLQKARNYFAAVSVLASLGGGKLCGIQPGIYEVFAITRLNEIFEISPTRQEAIESLT